MSKASVYSVMFVGKATKNYLVLRPIHYVLFLLHWEMGIILWF